MQPAQPPIPNQNPNREEDIEMIKSKIELAKVKADIEFYKTQQIDLSANPPKAPIVDKTPISKKDELMKLSWWEIKDLAEKHNIKTAFKKRNDLIKEIIEKANY